MIITEMTQEEHEALSRIADAALKMNGAAALSDVNIMVQAITDFLHVQGENDASTE